MKFDAKSESKKLNQNQKCKKIKKRVKLERGWIHAKLVLLAIDAEFSKKKSIDTQPAVEQNKSICAITMHPRRPRARPMLCLLRLRAPTAHRFPVRFCRFKHLQLAMDSS
jgi:hypothetical protein